MRNNIIEYFLLELNNTIRKKNNILFLFECILLKTYNKYQVVNIEYISNQTTQNALNIYLKTSYNKLLCFNVTEYINGYYISIPFIININPYLSIRYYDFCEQRNLIELFNKINKSSYLGNNQNTTTALTNKLVEYIKILEDFLTLEEVDKILHTDYWPDDIIYDWRAG